MTIWSLDSAQKQELLERFLRYVAVDTQSDDNAACYPSTEKQKNLSRILVAELVVVASGWVSGGGTGASVIAIPGNVTNTQALGALIYTHYIYPFQGCGLVLLVAMVGAIVLTLRRRPDAKRQDVSTQVAKPRGVRLVKVPTGTGV